MNRIESIVVKSAVLLSFGVTMSVPIFDDYATYRDMRGKAQPDDVAPLVSIVTATLNSAATLERTFRSVHAQTIPGIEHIIVDGGSRDGTLDLVRRFARGHDYWISEPDRGISDAFNKGVAMARGRYIQILNADDWLSGNQIECAVKTVEGAGADFAFGDLVFYEGNRPIFFYIGDAAYERVIHRRMPSVGHATMLASRAAFERAGLFDTSYAHAMDYDWLLRLHNAGGRGVYCPDIVGHMTHAGISNRNFRETIEEVREIAVAHGRNPYIAAVEARARRLKTSAAQPVRRHFLPLYQLARRILNPAYRPAPANR
jgi:glycosyltransferase involved in cell wall biosynthesis